MAKIKIEYMDCVEDRWGEPFNFNQNIVDEDTVKTITDLFYYGTKFMGKCIGKVFEKGEHIGYKYAKRMFTMSQENKTLEGDEIVRVGTAYTQVVWLTLV